MHHQSFFRQATSTLARTSKRVNWMCAECRQRTPSRFALRRPASTDASTDASPQQKPFYVTTPIFYVNAAPHVGHLYSMVLADIIKRHSALRGEKAILLTGTDEHGMKVQQAAQKAGSEPKPFCDHGAGVFKTLAARANISNDRFMRTTDTDHYEAVQYAWQLLKEKDLIYSSKHEGWYAVSDETFYPASAVHLVIEPWSGRKHMASIETGKEVEWTEEQNYHFRLSRFKEPLLEWYEKNPQWISPPQRHKQVVQWVSENLQDLSISRPASRLTWGIPVLDDPSQTIYVWLDALINYVTAAGYPFSPDNPSAGGWPADVQIIGKDIMRFHCIYWPAFLMALDLPLPKSILTHAHWTLGKEKMSKSTGNVVNPFFAIDRFGSDLMRYYLAREGGIKDDASYDNLHIIRTYNRDLKHQLGNCASRLLRSKKWSVKSAVRALSQEKLENIEPGTRAYKQMTMLREQCKAAEDNMRIYNVPVALAATIEIIYKTNNYIQAVKPWELAGNGETEKLETAVYLCAEALRILGILLQPYMPSKAALLLDMLGVGEEKRLVAYAVVGADFDYGESKVDLGKGEIGTLFPSLTSYD